MPHFCPGGVDGGHAAVSAALRQHGIDGRLLPTPPEGFPMWLIDVSRSESVLVEPWLSEAERERRLRFNSDALRRRYTVGHASLRIIIHCVYGISAELQEFSRNEFGKPFLARAPHLQFSMSYSGNFALIGIHEGSQIGVDIEVSRLITDARELSDIHYTAREQEEICRGATSKAELSNRFLCVWVKKEACLKASGRGLGIPLNEVQCGGGELEAMVQLSEGQYYRTGIIPLGGDPMVAWARCVVIL